MLRCKIYRKQGHLNSTEFSVTPVCKHLKLKSECRVSVKMVEQVNAMLASSQDHMKITNKLYNNHH